MTVHAYNLTPPARPSRRAGISFAEVLFSVMILGIGFIMLGGMFPVAIQQTQTTVEETAGVNIAIEGANYLRQIATDDVLTANNIMQPGFATIMPRAGRNMVSAQDPRFAWVPFYMRDSGSNFAQVIVIAIQCRAKYAFDPSLDIGGNGLVCPRIVTVANLVKGKNGDPDTATFTLPPKPPNNSRGDAALAPRAFVVMNDGRVYQLGQELARTGNSVTFELALGKGLWGDDPLPNSTGDGWVIGRGVNPDDTPSGPVMDIAAFTTFVQIK